jgi:acyl carrier protein
MPSVALEVAKGLTGEQGEKLAQAEKLACEYKGVKNYDTAFGLAEEVIKAPSDPKLEAAAYMVLARTYLLKKKATEMKDAAGKALTLFSSLRDVPGQAKALHMKALAYLTSGDGVSAVRNAQKALAIYKESGDMQGQVFELTAIAKMQLSQAKPYAALHAASVAYPMATKTDMSSYAAGSFEALALYLVCGGLVESGRAAQAVEKAKAGLKKFKTPAEEIAGYCILMYAQLYSNPDDALDTASEARSVNVQGDAQLDLLYMTAYAQVKCGQTEEAAKTLRQAVNAYGDAGQYSNLKGPEAEALRMISFALSGAEDKEILDEALQAAQEAKDCFKNDGLKSDEASALILMSVLKSQKEAMAEELIGMLKEAQELYSEVEDSAGEGSVLNLLTDLHVGSEQNAAALEYATSSVELYEKSGDEEAQAEALQAAANIYMTMKDYESAEEKIEEAQELRNVSKSLRATLSIMLAKLYIEEGMEDTEQEQEYKIKALKAAQTAVALGGQSGKKNLWAVALSWQSQVLAWGARAEEAIVLAEKSEKAFADTNDLKGQVMAMIKVAQLLKIMGKKADAKTKAQDALTFAQENTLPEAEKEAQSLIDSMVEKRPARKAAGGRTRIVRKKVKKLRKKGGGGAVAKSGGLDLAASTAKVSQLVKNVLADEDDLANDMPFMEAGVDSLGSVQLVTDVGKEFKMALAPSVVFDFPSVRALAEHLVAEAEAAAPAAGGGDDGEMEEYSDYTDVEEAIDGDDDDDVEYAPVKAVAAAPAAAASAAVVEAKKTLDPAMVHKKVLELVKNVLADEDDLAVDMPFMEAGVDSLGSVQLVTDIGKAFSMALAPSVVFDFPNVRALADHLVEESSNK